MSLFKRKDEDPTVKNEMSNKSELLAHLSLFLWVISLCLPSLVGYASIDYGWMILILGWLGIESACFAWYANIFFVLAFLGVKAGKPSRINSIIGIVLALETFRKGVKIPPNESSGAGTLYGYGIGAIIWVASIIVIYIATEVGISEEDKDKSESKLGIMSSYILLAYFLAQSAYFYVSDRLLAGEREYKNLQKVVFKKGPVCAKKNYKALKTVRFNGVLEIIAEDKKNNFDAISVEDLLSWGVPVVRRKGFDYIINDKKDYRSVVGFPSKGHAGTKIIEGENENKIYAKLISNEEEVFNVVWERDKEIRDYCPGYESNPKADEPPRNLIIGSLVLENGEKLTPLESRGDGILEEERNYREDYTVIYKGAINRTKFIGNMGCDETVGLRSPFFVKAHLAEKQYSILTEEGLVRGQSSELDDKIYGHFSQIFQSNKNFYFLYYNHGADTLTAVCDKDSVYLSNVYNDGSIDHLNEFSYISIQKRSIDKFSKSWLQNLSLKIKRDDLKVLSTAQEVKLWSVHENNTQIVVTLGFFDPNRELGELVEVAVPK